MVKKRLNKKISRSWLVILNAIFLTLFSYIIILPYAMPTQPYINQSKLIEVAIDKTPLHKPSVKLTSGLGYSQDSLLLFDQLSQCYFIINYYRATKSDHFNFYPVPDKLQLLVNIDDYQQRQCGPQQQGSQEGIDKQVLDKQVVDEHSIAVLNYKQATGNDWMFTEDRYLRNVRFYLAFEKFGIYRFFGISLVLLVVLMLVLRCRKSDSR